MEITKCPTLVDGKECGLDLVLVDQDVDTETEIYECPLGHRRYVAIGESAKRKCRSISADKECGLPLSLVHREPETATEIYECPLGHRTYAPRERDDLDEPSLE
jgi:hypothetical protein